MKSVINFRFSVLAAALLCVAVGSSALTLGKARSVVLLGKPLDLTIPVDVGTGDDVSTQCFGADVFYGDVQLESSRVSLSVQPASQAPLVLVRVTAQAAVDEPVVTVYFRAGCSSKASRKYVLLTDVVSELDTPTQVQVPLVRPPAAELGSVTKPSITAAMSDTTVASPARTRRIRDRASRVEVAVPRVVGVAAGAPKLIGSSKATQKARLKLTPLDLRVERDPILKSSDVLFDLPIEDLQKRAQAVATWRALNATPEEVMRQDAQLLSLDGSIKSLGELTVKNQDALLDLAARLERAQAERYRNPLVYGLIFGLLISLGGLAYLLLRMRRENASAGPWWNANGTAGRAEVSIQDVGTLPAHQPTAPLSASSKGGGRSVDSLSDDAGVDIDLEVRESAFTRLVQDSKQDTGLSESGILLPNSGVAQGHADFSYSVNATLRAINTQEMLDERQQADFFMTLGQNEDAIHLLEESIQHNVDANPLVYLDLLKMLHTLSRKAKYEHYRNEFNAVFSGRVPPFAHFSDKGYCLDAYEDVCQHIAALWPTEDALHFVEQCLVRTHDGLTQEFDLDAFRDLLTLHGVLLRIFTTAETGLNPLSTFKTQALSQKNATSQGGALTPFNPDQTMPLVVTGQGVSSVDLDLSESNNLLEFEEMALVPSERPRAPKQ